MEDSLSRDCIDTVTIDEIRIFMLLFADDTVLFSYTEQGLQLLLNKLHVYCNTWGITVNIDKSFVMVCQKGNRTENVNLMYDGHKLDVVKKFTYLGVAISQNGTYLQSQKQLSEQALRALYSLNRLFDVISLDIRDKLKLFDAMISPILNYGCEVWGFHRAQDIERVQLKFLKQILSVRQQTCNAAVYGELARFPLSLFRKIRIIRFWYKIKRYPGSLLYKVYSMKNNNGMYINTWTLKVKELLDELGFTFMFDCENVTRLLQSYVGFKHDFVIEKYLSCINNNKLRMCLTRFRCSAHCLNIEEGRYRNINREDRKCVHCNMNVVENEYHFLLICPKYRDLRVKYLPRYYCQWPNMTKFNTLLSTDNVKLLNNIATYISFATDRRNA